MANPPKGLREKPEIAGVIEFVNNPYVARYNLAN